MKKLIAALIATACAGAMAQFAVYDYSSSIKRLNPEIKKGSYKQADGSKVTSYLARFAVKSDKITGYVQLPICTSCNPAGVVGTLYEGEPEEGDFWANIGDYNENYADHVNDCTFEAWEDLAEECTDYGLYGQAFLTRKSDSFAQKRAQYPVYDVVVRAEIGIFGSYIDVRKNGQTIPAGAPEEGCNWYSWPVDGGKAATKAWMSLSYALPDPAEAPLLSNFVKSVADPTEIYPFGLLGWGNNAGSTVYETGFGTLSTTGSPDTENVCTGVTPGTSCRIVKQMSGSLTGWPCISAPCFTLAIWDLCDLTCSTDQAVITGTWTLKYNKSITGNGAPAAQYATIFQKLKVDYTTQVWDTTDPALDGYHQPENIPVLLDDYIDDCDAQP